MNRPISLVLLVAGCILLVYGINASESFSSEVSRAFSGAPTDRALWMIVGGAVAAVLGLAGLFRGSRLK